MGSAVRNTGALQRQKFLAACFHAQLCHWARVPIRVRSPGCPLSSRADRCPLRSYLDTREPEAAAQPLLPRTSGQNSLPHRHECSKTPGRDRIPEMPPNAQTKTALGKVGPTGTTKRRADQPLGLVAEPATRSQSRSQLLPRASEQLAGSWGEGAEEGARGQRKGQGQRGEPGCAPAGFAYLPSTC